MPMGIRVCIKIQQCFCLYIPCRMWVIAFIEAWNPVKWCGVKKEGQVSLGDCEKDRNNGPEPFNGEKRHRDWEVEE